MRRKEEAKQFITAFKDWINDTPLRIYGWFIALTAIVLNAIFSITWLLQHLPPVQVWIGGILGIFGVIWLSFMPYYNRNKRKSVKISVFDAYQPNKPPNKKGYINIDVEFSAKTSVLPIKISKIQLIVMNQFIEANYPILPIDQVIELESYVASFDLDYYLYFSNVMRDGQGKCRLWVVTAGHKWTSREFGLGNATTLLMRNKPDGINLVFNEEKEITKNN